jgi:AcrR family transcriptional regulator
MSDPMQPNISGSAFATAAAAASSSPLSSASAASSHAQGPGGKREQVVEALMRLAADQPWDDIELADIAREAGLTLSEMRDLFPSKGAILEGFTRMIDKKVIEGTTEDLAGEPSRERMFDVFMRRLDAMAPHKRALRRIGYAMRSDPLSMAALNRSALNSMRYMLASAGVATEGSLGFVKLQGSVIALANVMETWFDDDDPAQARTMARLDRELTRGERFLERADDVRRLTAPLRALGQALLDGGRRVRRRGERGAPDSDTDGETRDPAAAI